MTPPKAPARESADPAPMRFDAFISYRHVEPDRQWAQWLHGALETYRVPARLVKEKGLPRRLGRVFRDEDELPASDDLSAEIESALSQSRALIVICSPRTPASRWVNQEVERFKQMGREGKILALLIEGEPGESFPKALREIRHTVVDRDGSTYERIEEVEPLAADVRASRHESVRYLRRMARLRVMASLLDVKFDDLRQREQERRARRLAYVGALLAVLVFVTGGLALFALQQRNTAVVQRQVAESERAEAVTQRRRAEMELAQGTVLQGDALGSAGRWVEAQGRYTTAVGLYQANGLPPLAAELGLWDASRHVARPINTLVGHTDGVWCVALSPDESQVLSGGFDNTVRLWDLLSGRPIRTLSGHVGAVRSVAFLPDGKHALTASDDKTMKLWDLTSGTVLHTFAGHGSGIFLMEVASSGEEVVTTDETQLKLWSVADRKTIRTVELSAKALSLAVTPDGSRALCGLSDGKIVLLDLANGQVIQTIAGHDFSAIGVAFLSGGTKAISGSYDNSYRIWDLANGKQVQSIDNATDMIASFIVAPGGKSVVATMMGGMIKSIDLPDGRVHRSFLGHTTAARRIVLSRDGRIAVSAGGDKAVHVWDLYGPPAQKSWDYNSGPINGVGFTSDGLLAQMVSANGHAELWDLATDQTLLNTRPGRFVATAVAICPDGRTVLAGGLPEVVLADLAGTKPLLVMSGHTAAVESVAVSPDGKTGLSGGFDKTARAWDLVTGKPIQTLQHRGTVNSVAFSPDGKLAVTAAFEGVRLWDTRDWKEVRAIAGTATSMEEAVTAVVFSADGQTVLGGTRAGTLRQYDCAGIAPPRRFTGGHTKVIGCLALSNDGKFAVSGSDDHTVRLWNVPGGVELRVLVGHADTVRSVAISPDGRRVLAGAVKGSLKLWDFSAEHIEMADLANVAVARAAADAAPQDAAAGARLMKALGDVYAQHGLDRWAAAALQRAREGGVQVSPLALGRAQWKAGDRSAAGVEWGKALAGQEAPLDYLKLCQQAMTRSEPSPSSPSTAPATRPAN